MADTKHEKSNQPSKAHGLETTRDRSKTDEQSRAGDSQLSPSTRRAQ